MTPCVMGARGAAVRISVACTVTVASWRAATLPATTSSSTLRLAFRPNSGVDDPFQILARTAIGAGLERRRHLLLVWPARSTRPEAHGGSGISCPHLRLRDSMDKANRAPTLCDIGGSDDVDEIA